MRRCNCNNIDTFVELISKGLYSYRLKLDMPEIKYYYDSPLCVLEIQANDKFILSLIFVESKGIDNPAQPTLVINHCILQLNQYFAGERNAFELPLEIIGTDFQKKVWEALRNIPFASTLSYKELAMQLGDIKSIRAVAHANALNKFMIVLPCHRLIGTNGKLVGYAGGLSRKQWLLDHEKKFLPSGQMRLELDL